MAMATTTPPTAPPAIAPTLVPLEVLPGAEPSPPIAVWSNVILGFGRLVRTMTVRQELLHDEFRMSTHFSAINDNIAPWAGLS